MNNTPTNILFDDDKEITFVVDNKEVLDILNSQGVKTSFFDHGSKMPLATIMVQTKKESFLLLENKSDTSHSSQLLTIPQIAFDPSTHVVSYTLSRLFETDFKKAFDLQSHILEKLTYLENKLFMKTDDITLECDFSNEVDFSYPSTLKLVPGAPRSIASYLELHFEDLSSGPSKYFSLDGNMNIKGFLFAVHPKFQKNIPLIHRTQAHELLKLVAKSHNTKIEFNNNTLTSFKINDSEYIGTIGMLVGKTLGLKLTEFAFGLNTSIYSSVDWGVNAQINEGVGGIHLGVGDGKSGMHIDFICPDENIREII